MTFKVLTALMQKIQVFWEAPLCRYANSHRRFEDTMVFKKIVNYSPIDTASHPVALHLHLSVLALKASRNREKVCNSECLQFLWESFIDNSCQVMSKAHSSARVQEVRSSKVSMCSNSNDCRDVGLRSLCFFLSYGVTRSLPMGQSHV